MDVLGALRDYANGKTGAPSAIAGAIASHFLAVTSSRSLALVGGDDSVQSLLAHSQWFNPTDIRCTSGLASLLHQSLLALTLFMRT